MFMRKGGEGQGQKELLKDNCYSPSLNDVAGNTHNAGNGTHIPELCGVDSTAQP